jgi:hypothetical protein
MRRLLPCLLLCLCAGALSPGESRAWKTMGKRWESPTISYWVSDGRLEWPVEWGAYVWSASGANVRLVRAKSRPAAQVVFVAKQIPEGSSEAGLTELKAYGNTIKSAYVGLRLSLDPYQLALVATHELGHVIGLDHDDRGCSIMNSWLAVDHPFMCATPPNGKWWCRLLTANDVAGAIALYGGRPATPKQPIYCPRASQD